ncbi:MAG: phosphoglucosamine mutase, partial [Candidatus Kapaibacteriota bacterium]
GTIGESFTPNIVANYITAFSEILPHGTIVIGYDGRPSGKWIENIVVGTLLSLNRQVLLAGIVPTPTIQVLVEEMNAVGGISITASHNPEQWNGLKFINSDGTFFNKYQNQKLFEFVDNTSFKFPNSNVSTSKLIENPNRYHLNKIFQLPLFRETDLSDKIKSKKFKVVFDADNASGSEIIPTLLEELGCEVIKVNCNKTGIFIHPPEPLPQNILDVANIVRNTKADIGFVVDPDADRLVLIDESGNPVLEEMTIALAIHAVGESLEYFYPKGNKVVINYSTTKVCEHVAKMFGLDIHRAPVGEINVVTKMKELDAVVGGEGSGGVILPQCHYGRDALVGITLILSLLSKLDKPLSKILEKYPKTLMSKFQVEIDEEFDEKIEELINHFGINLLDVNTEDGFRFESDFGWIHIRKSNTEPIARIIFEVTNENNIHNIYNVISKLFRVVKC